MELSNGARIDFEGRTVTIECAIPLRTRIAWGGAAAASLGVAIFLGSRLDAPLVVGLVCVAAVSAGFAARTAYLTVIDEFRGRIDVTTSNPFARHKKTFPYASVASLGIGETMLGYAPKLHLRDGRRVQIMWPHKDYPLLERSLGPVWEASGLARADPAEELKGLETEHRSATPPADGHDQAARPETRPQPGPPMPAAPIVVDGNVATMTFPDDQKGCAFAAVAVIGLAGASILPQVMWSGAPAIAKLGAALAWLAGCAFVCWKIDRGYALARIDFDGERREVRLVEKSRLGERSRTYPFAEIASIGIVESNDDGRELRLAMRLQDGQTVPLCAHPASYLHWHAILARMQDVVPIERRDHLLSPSAL